MNATAASFGGVVVTIGRQTYMRLEGIASRRRVRACSTRHRRGWTTAVHHIV